MSRRLFTAAAVAAASFAFAAPALADDPNHGPSRDDPAAAAWVTTGTPLTNFDSDPLSPSADDPAAADLGRMREPTRAGLACACDDEGCITLMNPARRTSSRGGRDWRVEESRG